MEYSEQEIQEIWKNASRITEQVLKNETNFQIAMDLTDEEMEAMYSVAYNYYMQGLYSDAKRCFGMLMFFNPLTYKYCLGMASSLHMNGEMENACLFYLLSTTLDHEQPEPYLHMAECLIRLEDNVGAGENLEKAITLCGDDQGRQWIKGRAQSILDNLHGRGLART